MDPMDAQRKLANQAATDIAELPVEHQRAVYQLAAEINTKLDGVHEVVAAHAMFWVVVQRSIALLAAKPK